MGSCLSTLFAEDSPRTTSRGGVDFATTNDAPLTYKDVQSRIESIPETKTATFGGLRVRYAYITQRGYYPEGASSSLLSLCCTCMSNAPFLTVSRIRIFVMTHFPVPFTEPNKANQDAYCVHHNFGQQPTDAFFAVFDGHGRDGDKCAQFAQTQLPILAEKYVSKTKAREEKLLAVRGEQQLQHQKHKSKSLELTKDQIQASMLKAHLECNRTMHRAHDLDDSLSGTTAISLYVHGRRNRITICNVGDSRAILGQAVDSKNGNGGGGGGGGASSLRALPLSRDQTPYRRDERVRVKKTGARILSLDQIEGLEPINDDDDDDDDDNDNDDDLVLGEELDEGGDPPRVWSADGEYPGTAFTRSLGDAIAEELGVFAEPEMLTRELSEDDKIIVLASDGVFEFLTNQSVIDMCAKFSDPLEACRAVVAASYDLWLQYELRTDDITMICIFVDQVDKRAIADSFTCLSSRNIAAADAVNEDTPEDPPDNLIPPTEVCKPVRHHISKEKSEALRKMKIKMPSGDLSDSMQASDEIDLSKLYTKKTEEEKARIAEAIRASVMFQNITEEERELIFGVMEPIHVKKGTWVIKQGTVGDRFYIVDTGRFEVRIVPDGEEDDGSGGNVVHYYEGSAEKHAHPSFGELALMYSAPRAASIIAVTDGQLWALHRYAFRQVLAQQSGRKELIHTLKTIEAFRKMKLTDIQNIAASMEEVTFARGEA